jgi:mRNA interferase RelE/StbE
MINKLNAASEDPRHFLDRLVGDTGYKLRIGDYRAIVDVLETEKVIAVRVVGHRKNVYKRNL